MAAVGTDAAFGASDGGGHAPTGIVAPSLDSLDSPLAIAVTAGPKSSGPPTSLAMGGGVSRANPDLDYWPASPDLDGAELGHQSGDRLGLLAGHHRLGLGANSSLGLGGATFAPTLRPTAGRRRWPLGLGGLALAAVAALLVALSTQSKSGQHLAAALS